MRAECKRWGLGQQVGQKKQEGSGKPVYTRVPHGEEKAGLIQEAGGLEDKREEHEGLGKEVNPNMGTLPRGREEKQERLNKEMTELDRPEKNSSCS
jgi:hypothetical protein